MHRYMSTDTNIIEQIRVSETMNIILNYIQNLNVNMHQAIIRVFIDNTIKYNK